MNIVRSNNPSSLWNYTLSPGWTQEEVEILRQALMAIDNGSYLQTGRLRRKNF